MRKKLDNFIEKINKKIEKYININNFMWFIKVLLKLIYMEE